MKLEKLWIQGCGCRHSQHSHISHQTGSPTTRPQCGLRSQLIYPNLSQFIPIFLLPNNTLTAPAFPWHSLSAPRAFPSPIPAGDPWLEPLPTALPRTKERGISGSGLGTAPGAPESRDLGGTGAAASLHPEMFFPPQLPDLGNDSGDRNPG